MFDQKHLVGRKYSSRLSVLKNTYKIYGKKFDGYIQQPFILDQINLRKFALPRARPFDLTRLNRSLLLPISTDRDIRYVRTV